ncbi:hypothetical protein C8Q74DRAFT_292392 [Fomes fomentarius]|nr:hypothetical protein C8Q74DRAFT_292392 [Fomes fomentarius]
MMVTLPAAYIVAASSKSRAHPEEVPAMQVDDTDPSIQYVGDWMQDNLEEAMGHSRHGAPSVGLTVSYKFHGTGIEVFGTIGQDSGRPSTQYAIDGQHPKFYTVPPSAATPDTQRQFNVSFYSQHGLGHGEHTLTITNLNGTSPNIFWLDYFIVDTPNSSEGPEPHHSTTSSGLSESSSETSDSLPSSSTVIASKSSSASASQVTTSTSLPSTISTPPLATVVHTDSMEPITTGPSSYTEVSANATVTTNSDVNGPLVPNVSAKGALSQDEHHTNTSAIVGGIMGVLLVIAVVIIFALIRKRRQGKERARA